MLFPPVCQLFFLFRSGQDMVSILQLVQNLMHGDEDEEPQSTRSWRTVGNFSLKVYVFLILIMITFIQVAATISLISFSIIYEVTTTFTSFRETLTCFR